MAFCGAFNAGNALADDRFGNDELGFPVFGVFGGFNRRLNGPDVVPVNLAHIPAQGFVYGARIRELGTFRGSVQRDVVGIVNENKVIQLEHGGQGEGFPGDAFLQAAVSREAEDVLGEDIHAGPVEPGSRAPGGEGEAYGVRNALAQRSRGAFYTLRIPEFRVAGRDGTFAAEILDIFNADVES